MECKNCKSKMDYLGEWEQWCPRCGTYARYYSNTPRVDWKHPKNLGEPSDSAGEPLDPLLGEVLELANSHSYTTTITPNYIGNPPYTKKIIHYDVLCKIIDDIQRKHFA